MFGVFILYHKIDMTCMTEITDEKMTLIESHVLKELKGRFVDITDEEQAMYAVTTVAKTIAPNISNEDIKKLYDDVVTFYPISDLLFDQNIEDIMINNTENIFVYDSANGSRKLKSKIPTPTDLQILVDKFKLYATNESASGKILDVHLPSKSRVNIINSPLGYNITIRNFKSNPLSMIDLINNGELDYNMAAKLWIYVDGFRTRPANIMIGGIPAAGKTTLLNAFFSFFRPEQRVVTIEETYELDTRTQENCVRIETSNDLPLETAVENTLRMRPDLIIVGEIRGSEANDLMTAMNVGKIAMGTIHASSSRDIVNRLIHSPMNVPQDIIPVIDALIVLSFAYENGIPKRRIMQISEIAGIETQVLLSDIYKFDYKTKQSAVLQEGITYRDLISRLLGIQPTDIIAEQKVRAAILERMNTLGIRNMHDISVMVKDYYDNPMAVLKKLDLGNLSPAVVV
jgi:flagellar protein FlaI